MLPGAVKTRPKQLWERLTDKVGGPARLRVVLLLAGVLSLASADAGTIGAVALQLEKAFRIDNTEVGLLITVSSLVGAAVALPVGALADRSNRVRMLIVTIALWAASMVASGLSSGYVMLLCTRLLLGMVAAAAAPLTASLTGDLFPAKERSRIYSMVLTGELLGAGVGLVLSADVADAAGWRAPFLILAVPSLALCYAIYRLLPEPARGGQSWLQIGAQHIVAAEEIDECASSPNAPNAPLGGTATSGMAIPPPVAASELRQRARRRPDIGVRRRLVINENPANMALPRATWYVLRIPSNLVLIGTSVLGYFFLAGLRSFAVIFTESHYQLSQALVPFVLVPIGAGAVVGTLFGGRIADALIQRNRLDARMLVPGICLILAAALFAPALVSTLFISMPLYALAATFLSAPNPALDAARLDIVPSRLWGRGEAVRTFARSILEASAPLVFGYLSSVFGGPHASFGSGVRSGGRVSSVSLAESHGLEDTFLVMLLPLVLSGVTLLFARRPYLRDVATADESERIAWPANVCPTPRRRRLVSLRAGNTAEGLPSRSAYEPE